MSKKKDSRKKSRGGSETKSTSANEFRGRLDITRSGMGFVIVDQLEQDILIRPNDFNTAMHGDTVRVRITKSAGRSARMQGVVTEVMGRKQNVFMGRIEISKSFAFFISDSDKPMPDIYAFLRVSPRQGGLCVAAVQTARLRASGHCRHAAHP